MSRTWLILDVNNLAWRAFHSTGGLAHGGEPTGVLFGVLRDLQRFQDEFATRDVVFAFDFGNGLREGSYPFYKESRRKRVFTDAEESARNDLAHQITSLRRSYLESLGYSNIFYARGFEADDVIASAVRGLPRGDRAVMVSSDRDLYQLLSRNVSQYSPAAKAGLYTTAAFQAEYGIHPSQWPEVKAIAGCDTDDIPGMAGVGEITAAKWLRGELRGAKKDAIDAFVAGPDYRGNLELVTLPYPNCPGFRPAPDDTSPADAAVAWTRLCERFGIWSLDVGDRERGPVRTGAR